MFKSKIFCVCLFDFVLMAISFGQHHLDDFEKVQINEAGIMIDGYFVHAPKYRDNEIKYPLLVFLHGGALVGGDMDEVIEHDLPKLIYDDQKSSAQVGQLLRDSFVVLIPHLNRDTDFYNATDEIEKMVLEVSENLPVDKGRIYLTGLSRGGHGSFGVASRLSHLFAAVIPIAGNIGGVQDFEALADLPIWIVHNTGDQIVPVDFAKQAIRNIEAVSNSEFLILDLENVSFEQIQNKTKIASIIPKDSHNAWTAFYNNRSTFQWLLAQRRSH